MTTGTNNTLNYTYDSLKRLQSVKAKTGSTTLLTTAYAYRTVNGNQTSAQVEYRNVRLGENGNILEGKKYTYDANGNITLISQSTGNFYPLVSYEYDSQNQLTKETHYDGTGTGSLHITNTYVYTYDTAGNIQSEVKRIKRNGRILSTSTKSYTYAGDDSNAPADWKDLLTEFNDQVISYDECGNPETYYDGSTMQWENGRQLTQIRKGSPIPINSVTFAYDADGIRTKKSVTKSKTNTTHNYITQNGKVMRETIGSGSTAKVLDFIYDESGRPFALI